MVFSGASIFVAIPNPISQLSCAVHFWVELKTCTSSCFSWMHSQDFGSLSFVRSSHDTILLSSVESGVRICHGYSGCFFKEISRTVCWLEMRAFSKRGCQLPSSAPWHHDLPLRRFKCFHRPGHCPKDNIAKKCSLEVPKVTYKFVHEFLV